MAHKLDSSLTTASSYAVPNNTLGGWIDSIVSVPQSALALGAALVIFAIDPWRGTAVFGLGLAVAVLVTLRPERLEVRAIRFEGDGGAVLERALGAALRVPWAEIGCVSIRGRWRFLTRYFILTRLAEGRTEEYWCRIAAAAPTNQKILAECAQCAPAELLVGVGAVAPRALGRAGLALLLAVAAAGTVTLFWFPERCAALLAGASATALLGGAMMALRRQFTARVRAGERFEGRTPSACRPWVEALVNRVASR